MCRVDLEARERQAETVKTEEIKITRTLEEEVRARLISVNECVYQSNRWVF